MKTSSSDKEWFPSKESFIILLVSMCFTLIINIILSDVVKDNKILINKLEYEIEQLQIKDESMVQYLNADRVKFVLEQYDSIDTQLSNHLDMILENQNDIVRLRKQQQ